MIGSEQREEGRVHAELTAVDLHYQICELRDFVEQRFSEQALLLKSPRRDRDRDPTMSYENRRSLVQLNSQVTLIPENRRAATTSYTSPIRSPRQSLAAAKEDPALPEDFGLEAADRMFGSGHASYISAPSERASNRGSSGFAGDRRSQQSLPFGSFGLTGRASRGSIRNSTYSTASSAFGGAWGSLSSYIWEDSGRKFAEKAKVQAQRLRASRTESLKSRGSKESSRWDRCCGCIGAMVASPCFTNGIMVLILINVIMLGVEVDLSGELGILDVPVWLKTSNAVFVTIFVLELIMRFLAVGWGGFWCGEDSSWNIFDFIVIAVSVVDVGVDYLAVWLLPNVNTGQLRLVRAIRLARALRGIRIVWLFQYVGALRTLALSIISTSGSLFWTIVILAILVYSFGVVTTQLVIEHCRFLAVEKLQDPNAVPQCPESLSRYWSSVGTSMLTLFASISGGLDWESALQPLRKVSAWAVGLVLIYITITVFAVLNVVIGVFCNRAIENAHADKELASIKQVYTKSNQVQTLKQIFQEIDASGAEEVSIEDLEEAMRAGELKNFLESMGISTDDVWTLCLLLDTDRSGTIDLDEFVTGCMQLHGPAKSMQLAKMSFENRSQRRVLKQLAHDLHVIKSLIKTEPAAEREQF